MQVDYCTEAKLFDEKVDISTCKAMSDLKAGIPSDIANGWNFYKNRHEVCSAFIQEEMYYVNGQYIQ